MRLAVVVTALVLAAACGSEQEVRPTAARTQGALAWSVGVDPTQPGKALPVAPVVAPVALSKHDDTAVLTTVFQTKPAAVCQMEVAYDGRSAHQLLPPAVADRSGLIRWTWTPEAPRGRTVARIVCSGGQRGEMVVRAR